MIKKIVLQMMCAILLISCSVFTNHGKSPKEHLTAVNPSTTTLKEDTSKKAPKPYSEVITARAITNNGFFKVHKVDDKYYFEIPDSLLDRDLLVVGRVAKSPVEGSLYGGLETSENVIRFSKGPKDKIFLKWVSHLIQSNDSSENGMYRAKQNSSSQPIMASFNIAAFAPRLAASVIDVTKYINGDNDLVGVGKGVKKIDNLSAMDPERSYIESIKSFPINIEIKSVRTYNSSLQLSNSATYEMNTSFVLLPKVPLQKRFYDRRVGYFFQEYGDFDKNPQGYEVPYMVNRWRLEPKPEDVEKYERGELVEPAKPIVYYIDPATPKKWVRYLIQGVNDWQKAFEKAGFKNAIYALEAPKHDSTWSLYDATHNAIIYMAAAEANAMGPHIHDPRSGEILETHVYWFHNVMQLLHDWYMVQAGPNDPRARRMQFDDELMGQLIRFVSSHEVGHTLGLQHNFGASSTIAVEKLRDKQWVEENGFCPSIMDYARFNYVAQPEDNISEKGIFPRIGVYDEFAIEWGYRWFNRFKSREEEETYLNDWVSKKTSGDKRLWFGSQPLMNLDSRAQSEDLGDDPVLASIYGIKNLKRIVPEIPIWSKEPNQNYDNLERIRNQVMVQYRRYIAHISRNIGGVNLNLKFFEQLPQRQVIPTPKALQQSAVKFLGNEILINEPTWLTDFDSHTKYFSMIGGTPPQWDFLELRDTLLGSILSIPRLQKIAWFAMADPNAYTVSEYLNDMRTVVWSNLAAHKGISMYEKFTEQSYVSKLIYALNYGGNSYVSYMEFAPIVRLHAQEILKLITETVPHYKDEITKTHLLLMERKLKTALNDNLKMGMSPSNSGGKKDEDFNFKLNILQKFKGSPEWSCFEEWFRGDLAF